MLLEYVILDGVGGGDFVVRSVTYPCNQQVQRCDEENRYGRKGKYLMAIAHVGVLCYDILRRDAKRATYENGKTQDPVNFAIWQSVIDIRV